MAVTRTNILKDSGARDKYIDGVLRLKREVANPQQQTSTWDAFVIWHQNTMMKMTPHGNQAGRNAAHRGPVFLPWHRFMLIALERQIQRVLNDPTFALPYWAWNKDGDLPRSQQVQSPLWKSDCMGGSGFPVTTGPFAFDPDDPNCFRVRVESTSSTSMGLTNRGLRRALGQSSLAPTLPTTAKAKAAVALTRYDSANWDAESTGTFRNVCEGWKPDGPGLHNRVHVWIGGDMGPGTSPNDPVFYLNHCNCDRMWAAWQTKHPTAPYLPGDNEPASLLGHRLGDPLTSMFSGTPPKVRDMLNVSAVYKYDTVADLV
ncbi:MAG TPA: tyrosinase family protein [Allosphingosinicella sp.]